VCPRQSGKLKAYELYIVPTVIGNLPGRCGKEVAADKTIKFQGLQRNPFSGFDRFVTGQYNLQRLDGCCHVVREIQVLPDSVDKVLLFEVAELIMAGLVGRLQNLI